MKVRLGAAVLIGAAAITAAAPLNRTESADTASSVHSAWSIDPAHSTIGFSVRHFFTPVKGRFSEYEVAFEFDPESPETSSVRVVIDVSSVDTNKDRRDNHLQSTDFFDAESFPSITFESTSIEAQSATQFTVTGDLTIRDVTREVEMPVALLGVQDIPEDMQEMYGSQVASFEGELTIDRADYDVGSGRWAENTVVGSDVTIQITIEAKHEAH